MFIILITSNENTDDKKCPQTIKIYSIVEMRLRVKIDRESKYQYWTTIVLLHDSIKSDILTASVENKQTNKPRTVWFDYFLCLVFCCDS